MQDISRKLTRRPSTCTHNYNTTISTPYYETQALHSKTLFLHMTSRQPYLRPKRIKWWPCCVSQTNPVGFYSELFSHVKTLFCSNMAAVDHAVLKKHKIYLMSAKIVNSILKFPLTNVLIIYYRT